MYEHAARLNATARLAAAIGGLMLAAALALCSGPALANSSRAVTCGQTLTRSVKLTNDLRDCPGQALIVGADGITVDLDGHTLDGAGNDGTCAFPSVARNGIDNPGYDGVTVENGTVQQFSVGISAGSVTNGVTDSRVHHMTLRDNSLGGVSVIGGTGAAASAHNRIDHNVASNAPCGAGLKLTTGWDNSFDNNHVDNSSDGIVICCGETTDGNAVAHNAISDVAESGILVFSSGSGQVTANTISDAEVGVHVNGRTTDELVQGNAISRTQHTGILVEPCCDDTPDMPSAIRVLDNTLSATGDGIWIVESDRDVVARNSVAGAGTFGDGAFGTGVLLNGASDTRVYRNTITDGGRGFAEGIVPGIVVGLPFPFPASPRPVTGNAVVANTVSGQLADGILVADFARDTLLKRNLTDRNTGDGLNIQSAATTITRNTADHNGALGIEALPGVTDGGHNHAHGNGNPAQCTGVACT
jgi:hypothetical protein